MIYEKRPPLFEVTTMIGCPMMCTYCPQDKLQRAYKDPVRVMTHNTFQTALDRYPKDLQCYFAGYTEPWANKNCTDFVQMALEQGRKIYINTTLDGITAEDGKRLLDLLDLWSSQVVCVCLHLPDVHNNMRGWRYTDEYKQLLDMFLERKKKYNFYYMTMDSAGDQVHPSLRLTSKRAPWWKGNTRAGNLDTSLIKAQFVWPTPRNEFVVECLAFTGYHSSVLLPNGDITLCCQDYGLKHILGNILHQTYEEIMSGAEITKIKSVNDSLEFSDQSLCKTCSDTHCKTPWNDEEVKDRWIKIHPDFEI